MLSVTVAQKTKIPVPKVLAWSATTSNPVGSEYILLEHITGVPLVHKWHQMSPEQHIKLLRSISPIMQEMGSLTFPAYGSIYFTEAPFSADLGIKLPGGFQIGPHCATMYWDCSVGEKRYNHWRTPSRGPCKTHRRLCNLTEEAHLDVPRDCTG